MARTTSVVRPTMPYGVHLMEALFEGDQVVYSILIAIPHKKISTFRYNTKITKEELRVLKDQIINYADRHYEAFQKKDAHSIEDSLLTLNKYGKNLYTYIFERQHGGAEVFTKIHSHRQSVSNFYVYSEHFAIPYEFLTPATIKGFSSMNFWGSQWNFQRIYYGQENEVKLKFPLSVSVLSNLGFDKIRDIEHKFLIQSTSRLKSNNLNELEFKNAKDLLSHLRSKGSQILHFACHLENIEGDGESKLHFNEALQVRVSDFAAGDYLNKKLVFVNACKSGVICDVYKTGFPAAFLKAGAGGVITVDIDIDDEFAAHFSKEYYNRLMDGFAADVALDLTKKYFLMEGQVLCLFYSYNGSPSQQKNAITYSTALP